MNFCRAIIVIALCTPLFSCSEEPANNGVVWVPDEHNIPGSDQQLHIIPLQPTSAAGTFNFNREQFGTSDPVQFKLDVQLDEEILALSLDNNRFVVLDKVASTMYEIHVSSETIDTLATPGSGPGELSFPVDLSLEDGVLWVFLGIGKILKFDCNTTPCSYEHLISTSIRPSSGTHFPQSNQFVLSGAVSFTFSNDGRPSDQRKAITALSWIDSEGNSLKGAGTVYNYGTDWMLAEPFINRGYVREKDSFAIFTNQRLPLIGLINPAGNETLYKLDGFLVGKQSYDAASGRLEALAEDHSRIKLLPIGSDHRLIAEVSHFSNRRIDNFSYRWDIVSHYYTIESPFPALSPFGTFEGGTFLLASSDTGILFSRNGSIYFKAI